MTVYAHWRGHWHATLALTFVTGAFVTGAKALIARCADSGFTIWPLCW